jgi:hypothetical protein
MKEDKTRTSAPKPPETKKRKNAESSDESDSQDKLALMPKDSVGGEGSQGVEADLRRRGMKKNRHKIWLWNSSTPTAARS